MLELPFKHKGIMTAPLIGEVHLGLYLQCGQIEQVIAGGKNYDGARPCNMDWVRSLRNECEKYNVTFCFIETGTNFIKDAKTYHIPKKRVQSEMALKSGMSFVGRPIKYIREHKLGEAEKAHLMSTITLIEQAIKALRESDKRAKAPRIKANTPKANTPEKDVPEEDTPEMIKAHSEK